MTNPIDLNRAAINEGVLALIKISGENSRDHGFHEDWPLEPYPTVTATGAPAPGVTDDEITEHKRQEALSVTQKLMLMVEETTEAFGEIRDGRGTHEIYYVDKKGLIGDPGQEYPMQAYGQFTNGSVSRFSFGVGREVDIPLLKPEGFLVEIADLIIRAADLVYLLHAQQTFLKALAIKHEYNATRPYKHGRKF